MSAPGSRRIAEGQFTSTVYGLIRDLKYDEAIKLLATQVQHFPKSRAALSLLAYCYYHAQDYANAAVYYEQLTKVCPEVEEYKVYHAQALYKSGLYAEAARACTTVDSPSYAQRVLKLQAAVRYEQDEPAQARQFIDQCLHDDPDVIVAQGCVLYKEGKFEEAKTKFSEAMNLLGYQPLLAYNLALCYYRQQQFPLALKEVAQIIERGIREHPELSVGSNTEGIEVRSVGNSAVLQETALIEAFNLKAAIEYQVGNLEAAKEALSDMPPRSEEELDPVTLHNQAIIHMEDDPNGGIRKLGFLLQQAACPPETFANLIITYCKNGFYDLAADVLAENSHLTYKHLSPETYEFIDALITQQTSPEEAYRKLDDLATKHTDTLRKFTKQVQDARTQRDQEALKRAIRDYDEALERFIPVLMAMARIYWDRQNYPMVEKIFRQSAEFCSEHKVWRLNVAHTFFMQDDKWREAIRYYEPIVQKAQNILSVTAIVLANLCVSYIMMGENPIAEELMKRIEAAEREVPEHEKQPYHLCIVNLVIGTLYCSKGNYEFGISRVIKSLEPYNKKLATDTWFLAKRCFVGLLEAMAKHMYMLPDATFHEIITFLDAADQMGKSIPTVPSTAVVPPGAAAADTKTVSSEARLLKKMFLKMREW